MPFDLIFLFFRLDECDMLIKPLQNIKNINKIQVKYFLKNNVFRYTAFTFEIINCCFDLTQHDKRIFFLFAKVLQEELTVAVAQWVRALATQTEGWMFESQPRQT